MAFASMVDFEGDQWTFFKPPPEDLLHLHGIDVHEMQLFRPAVDHVIEQLRARRTMTMEVDSYYLPDTMATTYKQAHVKSSIAVEAIDPSEQRLRYFHAAGYYELSGGDYSGVFRIGRSFSADVLPPYVEVVHFDAAAPLAGDELQRGALESLRRHLVHKPKRNPWLTFGERLARDLPELLAGSDQAYHAYAFATVRQCGAAFDIARSFVEWMVPATSVHGATAAQALGRQVIGAKTLLLKLARRRAFDPAPAIAQLAGDWYAAMNALERLALSVEGRAA